MLEPIKIPKIKENDIDQIINEIGGSRIISQNTGMEIPHADYQIGTNLIELKILEEEPLLKPEKQNKIAEYYKDIEGDTVVIEEYNEAKGRDRNFLQIFETPVKTAFKKASRQLQSSRNLLGQSGINCLFLVNDGLQSLYHDEIKLMAHKCIVHDTKSIDMVVVAGIYYYSDGFDNFFLAPIDAFHAQIRQGSSSLETLLRKEWNNFVTKYLKIVLTDELITREKNCVNDFVFFANNRRYVKVAPGMGPSEIYKKGRPRENIGKRSGGCICTVIPDITQEIYDLLQKLNKNGDSNLKKNYPAYQKWLKEKVANKDGSLKPFISFDVSGHIKSGHFRSYSDLCSVASNLANEKLNDIAEDAIELRGHPIAIRFILVEYEEVGKDAQNDVSSISLIENEIYVRRLVVRRSMDYSQALALGAAYCLAFRTDLLYYKIDARNSWR